MSNNKRERKGFMHKINSFIVWMGAIAGFLSAILAAVSFVAPRAVEPIVLSIYQIETPEPRTVEVTIEAPQVAEVTRQVEVEATRQVDVEVTRLIEVEVTRLVEVEATREIVVTATPPPPTPVPETTSPGTILEEGQWWYSEGKRYIVDLVRFSGDRVILDTRFENISESTVTFTTPDQDFVLTDNLGNRYIASTVNCNTPSTITLAPGSFRGCTIFFSDVDFANLSVNQLIFMASPTTFEAASWKIPINH